MSPGISLFLNLLWFFSFPNDLQFSLVLVDNLGKRLAKADKYGNMSSIS